MKFYIKNIFVAILLIIAIVGDLKTTIYKRIIFPLTIVLPLRIKNIETKTVKKS